jgi:hypothetical protein
MAMAMVFAASASARSEGFDIWNLSSEPLRITGVSGKTNPPGEGAVFEEGPGKAPPPRVGELVQPGEHLHIELENPFNGAERSAKLVFSPAESSQGYSFYVLMRTEFENVCTVSSGNSRQCEVKGNTFNYLDPAGGEYVIDANNIIGQRKAITELCDNAHSCKFHPEHEEHLRTTARVVGNPVEACQQPVKTELTYKDSVGTTDSFGASITVSASFFELFKGGITATYGHARTETSEFSQAYSLEAPPYNIGWVVDKAPVIRDLGTYTLNLGNTKWVIKNVYFDSPDPGKVGIFGTRYKKLNEAEKKKCIEEGEKGPDGGKELAATLPPAAAQATATGSGTADLLRGYGESNEFSGLGGDDLILGGGGHDTLFGGGVNDTINGGQGEDTINGGPGADHIVDMSGPTEVNTGTDNGPLRDFVDVRDGKGDDTVICESPNSTVIADRRDQVDGECGRVIRGTQVGGSQS